MNKSDLPATIARIKLEIMEDVRVGRIPSTVASFVQLQDFVDANEYGGFCEDQLADAMILEFGGRDEHEGMPQGMLDFINAAQGKIDEWLAAGGIANFGLLPAPVTLATHEAAAHTKGPWITFVTPEGAIGITAGRADIAWLHYPAVGLRDTAKSTAEVMANAKLIKEAPDMLATLMLIERELSSHPDFKRGNSKIHFAVHKVRTAIKQAT